MTAFVLALAAAQAFSVTIPARSAIVNDGERVELPTCTTVVNNGVLVLLMPDGSRFVDEARRSSATVVVDERPVTAEAARIQRARDEEIAHQPTADIRVTYATRRGVRTLANLSMPLLSSSDLLSGSWRRNPRSADPADAYLDGETITLTVQGDAPTVRYVRGGLVPGRRGRPVPARWSVEAPIVEGATRASTATVRIGGYHRRVRLEVSVPRR